MPRNPLLKGEEKVAFKRVSIGNVIILVTWMKIFIFILFMNMKIHALKFIHIFGLL